MALPEIYNYLDYRRYLKDWYAARKAADPRFSHRAFVRRTGQRSPSFLKDLIEGRRNLTASALTGFCRAMKLSAAEEAFFIALVHLDQAANPDEKNHAWQRISATRRFREAHRVEGAGMKIISNWYYSAVRELTYRPDFVAEPAWIARQLRPRITIAQARAALSLLLEVGLLVQHDHGRVESRDVSLVTPHQVAGLAAHNYHLGMLDRAREAITNFRPHERHFCSVTVAVPQRLLPEIRRELDAVQERLLDLCNASDEDADQVIQLGLYCFPLSTSRQDPT